MNTQCRLQQGIVQRPLEREPLDFVLQSPFYYPAMSLALPEDYSTIKFKTILVHGIDPTTRSKTRSPRVVQVVIDRLQANNAFTQAMALEIRDVYSLFDVDERVRCIILTGAGDKFFCAGADLNANERTLDLNEGEREQDYRDG